MKNRNDVTLTPDTDFRLRGYENNWSK